MNQIVEIPLPSGIFARMRPINFLDRLSVYTAVSEGIPAKIRDECGSEKSANTIYTLALLTARAVTFDGERRDWEYVLDLDGRDAEALWTKLGPLLNGPVL